ncbi:MAG: MBL fold metallo-hydrolase [Oscillospiraceae bacterium]|nr:MBL fold metallo-hydrolase [Oscillospiraceae bacterium]
MTIRTLPVGSLETNCYLLIDDATKQCAVIDPGGDADFILRQIQADGVNVTAILLTHAHHDHTGAVPSLRERFPSAVVYLHPADAAMLGHAPLMPPVGNTTPYQEGDTLQVGKLSIKVLDTPGHTPGGVTLATGRTLFTGDTLFYGSIGRTDFPGGDYDAIMQSVRRLGRLDGDYAVLPGHMEGSTLAQERVSNPYMLQAMRG